MINKLGMHHPRHILTRPWFSRYGDRRVLRPDTVPTDWSLKLLAAGQPFRMFANGPDPTAPAPIAATGVGNCMWAGLAEMLRCLAATQGKIITFPTAKVVQAYCDCTGYVLGDDSTDQGTDPDQGFDFCQNTGIEDDQGIFHKIGLRVNVNPKDFEEVCLASNLFGGLGVGVDFLEDWDNSDVWDVNGGPSQGGHFIYGVSDVNINPLGIKIVSWARTYIITEAALAAHGLQVTAVLDPEMFPLAGGPDISGFDSAQLVADFPIFQQDSAKGPHKLIPPAHKGHGGRHPHKGPAV